MVVATRPLSVVVVDDAGFAKTAVAEWSAKSDVGLNVKEMTAGDFVQSLAAPDAKLAGDVVVYPARFIGELAERELISPVPNRVMKNESLVYTDILPLLRRRVMMWGDATFGLPVASRQLVTIFNEGALGPGPGGDSDAVDDDDDNESDEASQSNGPWQSWSSFDEQVAKAQTGDLSPVALPLGPGWAGSVFLARSAGYARDSGQLSTLFDFRTMKPRINTAPFVRALEDLAALAKMGDEKQIEWTPAEALAAVTEGKAAIAITWLGGEYSVDETVAPGLRIVSLPGAKQFFRFSAGEWQDRAANDDGVVPYIGFDDRIASVSAGSRRQRAAWNLVSQLTTGGMGARVMAASRVAGPTRGLQEQTATAFVGDGVSASVAKQNFKVVSKALRSRVSFSAIRLPGQTEYYTILDDAVRSVIAGETSASEALNEVAGKWETITDRLGRDHQLTAFEQSLGIQ